MAENATSWFQEDHSWRKATVHGENQDRIFRDILKPCSKWRLACPAKLPAKQDDPNGIRTPIIPHGMRDVLTTSKEKRLICEALFF